MVFPHGVLVDAIARHPEARKWLLDEKTGICGNCMTAGPFAVVYRQSAVCLSCLHITYGDN